MAIVARVSLNDGEENRGCKSAMDLNNELNSYIKHQGEVAL
jgi:hypothetical protein